MVTPNRYQGAVPLASLLRVRHFWIGLATAAAFAMMRAIDSQGQPTPAREGAIPEMHSRLRPQPPHATRRPDATLGPSIVEIGASAFPYEGVVPESDGKPFLQTDAAGNRFHDAPRGGKLSAGKTYSDPRSLLFIPSGFNLDAPAALVLFLHGNLATLARDVVRRQRVPEQVEASKLNVVLVAPQLAVDALDSSAGHFWQRGFLDVYLSKAAERLAALSNGRFGADEIDRLPVIVVAYSGGYLSTAFSLDYALAQSHSRIVGVVLLDALFGEEPKFAAWLTRRHADTFFVSAYSRSSADLNAKLEREAEAQGIALRRTLPAHIGPGDVIFQPALGAVHNDFVTQAYTRNPLQDVLARISLARFGKPSFGDDDGLRPDKPIPPSSEKPAENRCPVDAFNC